MKRRTFLKGSSAFTLLAVSPHAVGIAQPRTLEDADSDSVAIYSKLLEGEGTWLDADQRFGLDLRTFAARAPELRVKGETTQSAAGPLVPTITSPADVAPTVEYMVADLVRAGREPRPIPRGVTIPDACLLVSPEDIREINSHSRGATWNEKPQPAAVLPDISPRLRHVAFVVSYSAVGFSADRTLAIVAVSSSGDSTSESFWILGKTNSEWHALEWDIESVNTAS